MSAIRTDEHRPSAINPDEYELVALFSVRDAEGGDIDAAFELAAEREAFISHMNETGAKFSQHSQSEGAGQCQICGARCVDYAVFHHISNNEYIKTGFDCAANLDMGDERRFRNFRTARKRAEELKAGKNKAHAILVEEGLETAWSVYENYSQRWEVAEALDVDQLGAEQVAAGYEIINDLVNSLIKFGYLTAKQWKLLSSKLSQIQNAESDARERARKREQSEAVPQGKNEIKGKVISAKNQDTPFGLQSKMLVEDDRGFKVFGTVPNTILQQLRYTEEGIVHINLDDLKGHRVRFNANTKPSDDDATFGFFSRPSKAKLIKE